MDDGRAGGFGLCTKAMKKRRCVGVFALHICLAENGFATTYRRGFDEERL